MMSVYTKVILLLFCYLFVMSISDAREITEIIIHTTDMDRSCGAKCIDKAHKNRGWDSCGYHYVVTETGRIDACRGESKAGAHTKFFNEQSIGIAWLGKKGDMTPEQYSSLVLLAKIVALRYNISVDSIKGHKEYYSGFEKTCPLIDMDKFRKDVSVQEIGE